MDFNDLHDSNALLKIPTWGALQTVGLERDIYTIGKNAFAYCSRLTSFHFEKLIQNVHLGTPSGLVNEYAFAFSGLEKASFYHCRERAFTYSNVETIELRDWGTIGEFAFEGTPVTKIDITIKNAIDNRFAFANMPKLEEATINIYEYPYPLTSEVHIPEGMFQNCKSLKKFTSNGTSKVYQYAFMACTAPVSYTHLTLPTTERV